MPARDQRIQHIAAVAEHFDRISQVERWTNRRYPKAALEIALTQPCIDERRFPARIGTDQQACIRLLSPCDRRIEQVSGAALGVELRAVLAAIEARSAEAGHECLQRAQRLGVCKIGAD